MKQYHFRSQYSSCYLNTSKKFQSGVISRGAQGGGALLLKFLLILGGSAPLKLLYWLGADSRIYLFAGTDLKNFMTVAHRAWLVSRRGKT